MVAVTYEQARAPRTRTVNEAGAPPQVTQWVFRLHREGRPCDKLPEEVDWGLSAVGPPVRFAALQFGASASQALSSHMVICAIEALDDPAWSVSRAGDTQPTMTGKVGRPLAAGGIDAARGRGRGSSDPRPR